MAGTIVQKYMVGKLAGENSRNVNDTGFVKFESTRASSPQDSHSEIMSAMTDTEVATGEDKNNMIETRIAKVQKV